MAATISKTLFSSLKASVDFWAVFVYNTLELKRKITLFALLSTGIVLGYFSFITWFIGFLIAKYLGGKMTGERGRLSSFFIPLGKRKIHLHHWLLSSLLMGITMVKGVYFPFLDLFYGFFGGIVFHGIYCYRDWYKILVLRRVQSLVVAKNLAIGKFTASASSIGMGEGRRQLETTSEED